MDRRSLQFILTIIAIILATIALYLYAKGYSYDRQRGTLEKTGMIIVKSTPDGARIYLNDKLVEATNANLTNLSGGLYRLRVEKDGHSPFEKDVPVRPEYATLVEAVVIPLNPELKPLTTTGAKNPVLTASHDKILFATDDKEKPGIWTLNLTGNLFSLFKGNLEAVLTDKEKSFFSLAQKIILSPTDEEALVEMNTQGYFLADLTKSNPEVEATNSAEVLTQRWQEELNQKKLSLANRYKVPKTLLIEASQSATLWSPDERKFLYYRSQGQNLEYRVYNTTDPLGVGEKEEYSVIKIDKTQNTKFTWFSDSKHLILANCERENKEKRCLAGSIHLIRIDGTNKTQVYQGTLSSTEAFPTPDGSKIIILTSFNENTEPNLYAIILH